MPENKAEMPLQKQEIIYADDLIEELQNLKDQATGGANQEQLKSLEELVKKIEFLEKFGIAKEDDIKMVEKYTLIKKIESLLEKAELLKKVGKKMVIINS